MHDRVVIATNGEAFTLGTSLNGVGQRSTTVFSPLPAVAASALREEVEVMWQKAEPIRQPELEQGSNAIQPMSAHGAQQGDGISANSKAVQAKTAEDGGEADKSAG